MILIPLKTKVFWIVLMTFGAEPSIELLDDYQGQVTYEDCMIEASNVAVKLNELATCLFIE